MIKSYIVFFMTVIILRYYLAIALSDLSYNFQRKNAGGIITNALIWNIAKPPKIWYIEIYIPFKSNTTETHIDIILFLLNS